MNSVGVWTVPGSSYCHLRYTNVLRIRYAQVNVGRIHKLYTRHGHSATIVDPHALKIYLHQTLDNEIIYMIFNIYKYAAILFFSSFLYEFKDDVVPIIWLVLANMSE